MPAAGWRKHSRDPAHVERDLDRYRRRNPRLFPDLERIPDLSPGDRRFAAEVAIAEISGQAVPSFAHERAFETLLVMAKG